jgi:perosamine synthetase
MSGAPQVAQICAAVRAAIGEAPAALHEPEFVGNESRYLKDCIDTGWVSSAGAYVDRFERQLAEVTGARHAIAVVNGTAALHLALVVAGVRAGDEVLVPALTFIATANAVAYCGATPHFVVEDAAEAIGTQYKGRHVGHHGVISALSFNGNKTITTGGGGALITDDEATGRRAKHLSTTARLERGWEFVHDEVFAHVSAAKFCAEPAYGRSNYWLNAILLEPQHAALRDQVLAASNAAGHQTRPAWTLMHRLAPFSACPRMPLEQSESISARLVNLPSSARLGRRHG